MPLNQRRAHPKFPNRAKDRGKAIDFFLKIYNANIKFLAVENPVGIINTKIEKLSQIIQPYQFGDSFNKPTCLWIKNLPLLEYTNIVDRGEFITLYNGKRISK